MYKNTIKNKTGKSSGRVHGWNLFMALLLFILSCPLSSIAEDAKPFDCTMPVIMEPIMRQLHRTNPTSRRGTRQETFLRRQADEICLRNIVKTFRRRRKEIV